MGKSRTKKRTHVGAKNGPASAKNDTSSTTRTPKSMVIRIGGSQVGTSVSQLVQDVRLMMEPHTAVRLRVSSRRVYCYALFPNLVQLLGTKSEQIERLHDHGRTTWCYTSSPLFKVEHRQHKPSHCIDATRTNAPLQG